MKLNNGIISIDVAEHGAELKSAMKNGYEYMWCGDSKYWGRTSPVLFPFVGALKDKDPNLEGCDVREGIVAVVSIRIPEALFHIRRRQEYLFPLASNNMQNQAPIHDDTSLHTPRRQAQVLLFL